MRKASCMRVRRRSVRMQRHVCNPVEGRDTAFPQVSEVPKYGHLGLLNQESRLWLWVDTFYLGIWTLKVTMSTAGIRATCLLQLPSDGTTIVRLQVQT